MVEEAESQLGTVSKYEDTVLDFVLAWDSVMAAASIDCQGSVERKGRKRDRKGEGGAVGSERLGD